jgi:hypothetical protein
MIPTEAYDIAKYRPFTKEDVFPGLLKRVKPLLIYETDQLTFVYGYKGSDRYIFAWDKVSPVYNWFQYLQKEIR